MPTFASRPLNPSKGGLNGFLRQHPLAFGVPFVIIIIGASFGLKGFTDLGVEKKDAKVTVVTKDEEVKRKLNNARKFDIREEYFRHFSKYPDAAEWDNVRIARPQDVGEWGVASQDTRPKVKELVRKK